MNHILLDSVAAIENIAAAPSVKDVLPIIVLSGAFILVFYFFMIRPQKKRDKELKEQVDSMAVGDRIITIGGIVGTVANIRDDEITISTSVTHTMITFKKTSISTIIKRETDH